MPFTPSHVAAILPFARTPLYPAALVIGSMGPDLFYYVPLPISRDFTHSIGGVFSVDLLLGVGMFLLWERVFRRPLVDFAPIAIRARLAARASRGLRPPGTSWWMFGFLLVASVLLGTFTHVFWDSFTHAGATVTAIGWLGAHWGPLPAYKWAQYASSLFGAVVVVWWIALWLRRTPPVAPTSSRLATALRVVGGTTVLVAGLVVSLVIWIRGITGGHSAIDNALVFRTVTVGLAAAGLTAALWSIAWWVLPRR